MVAKRAGHVLHARLLFVLCAAWLAPPALAYSSGAGAAACDISSWAGSGTHGSSKGTLSAGSHAISVDGIDMADGGSHQLSAGATTASIVLSSSGTFKGELAGWYRVEGSGERCCALGGCSGELIPGVWARFTASTTFRSPDHPDLLRKGFVYVDRSTSPTRCPFPAFPHQNPTVYPQDFSSRPREEVIISPPWTARPLRLNRVLAR